MIIDNALILLAGAPVPKRVVAALYMAVGDQRAARLTLATMRRAGASALTTIPSALSVSLRAGGASVLRTLGRFVAPVAIAQTAVDAILVTHCACHCYGRVNYDPNTGNILNNVRQAVNDAFN